MKKLFLFSFVFIWFSACQTKQEKERIENYASALPQALISPSNLQSFMQKSQALPRIQRLAIAYRELRSVWTEVADPKGNDHFRPTQGVFNRTKMYGDCEDFSASMMSISLALGFQSHIVLGESNTTGHAWTEVQLSTQKPSKKLMKMLETYFQDSVSFTQRKSVYWMQFSPKNSLNPYTPHYIIEKDGKVTSLFKNASTT